MPSLSITDQVLLLLGLTVAVVLASQRFRVPTSLGYLLVGILLAPATLGPLVEVDRIRPIAEFGIVFLLFTIGLNFSLPQILALRHLVLGLGTAQVVLSTVVVSLIAWLAGLPPVAAFVAGAVFAQSSTTIISKQVAEQGEEDERHARLGVAMSVFQDVTAVPFVVVIPVLATAGGLSALGIALGWALAKAVLAFLLVFVLGRLLLRSFFGVVARYRSPELFTLTVLFVSLVAGWVTFRLGLSMAFGAFLAGMVLGETEFRHQVEATMRPFRDVLLGLFFVGIGLLVDWREVARIWHWAVLGAVVLLATKTLVVAGIVRASGIDMQTSWRTALLLAVGGEFGFALLALALQHRLTDPWLGQVLLTSVLFSMVLAPVLIRYNRRLARWFSPRGQRKDDAQLRPDPQLGAKLDGHVLVCGYGRIGQGLARLLEEEGIPYVALDLDADLVREARLAGEPVFFGDGGQLDVLDGLGLASARLVVISHDDHGVALKTVQQLRRMHPDLPVLVRTRDLSGHEELHVAGATEVVPETLEAGLAIAWHALLHTGVPQERIHAVLQRQRASRYQQQRALLTGRGADAGTDVSSRRWQMRPFRIVAGSPVVGRTIESILGDVVFTALVREGRRIRELNADLALQEGDVLVVAGTCEDLAALEARMQAVSRAKPAPRPPGAVEPAS